MQRRYFMGFELIEGSGFKRGSLFVWREIADDASSHAIDSSLKQGVSDSVTASIPLARVKRLNKLLVQKLGIWAPGDQTANRFELPGRVARSDIGQGLRV